MLQPNLKRQGDVALCLEPSLAPQFKKTSGVHWVPAADSFSASYKRRGFGETEQKTALTERCFLSETVCLPPTEMGLSKKTKKIYCL